MIDLSGRVLLLTGAAGSIGQAVAQCFASLGAHLVLTDLDEAGLARLAATFDAGTVATLKHDSTSAEDAKRAVALAEERYGGLDFVITGAGLYHDRLVAEMTEAEWRQSIAINLDGVFHVCHAAAPRLREGGAIVNIASLAAHRGSYEHAHYAAAKGGVLAFTRSLALELAPRVRVNAVSPGIIDTPMIESLMAKRGAKILADTPLGRLGRADEVARAIAFLCSDWASFITGTTLQVNGGLYMAG